MHLVEKHLTELLYAYDCVTLPGLGGFIMHYRPAKISRDKGRIYPPGRVPSFNSLLAHDDGLLQSSIARAEKISYDDAGSIVNGFVRQCKQKLSQKQIVALENIGKLSASHEGALQFHPLASANFLSGVFGMDPLLLMPVSREKPHMRTSSKPADRKKLVARSPQPSSVKWTMILSAPVIIFLIYGIIFPRSFQTFYADFSQTIPGLFRLESRDHIPSQGKEPSSVVVDLIPALQAPDLMISEIPAPTAPPADLQAPAETVPENTVIRYHIIGGCFENRDNARKFLSELRNKGFNAEEAGLTARGHLRICYQRFEEKAEAIAYLNKIKSEENPDAWLLKY